MKTILLTGASGNVGSATLAALQQFRSVCTIRIASRNVESDTKRFAKQADAFVPFDFVDSKTYQNALAGIDVLFLLRPPELADVDTYFRPLIEMAKAIKLPHIVFLSVQGAEKSTLIPHHKIEALIRESGIAFTFLRPAYFMQNFTGNLFQDLKEKHEIFLPAGKAKFVLIDVRNIGEVAAKVLAYPAEHSGNAYELTGNEILNFEEMAKQLSTILPFRVHYISPSLLHFYLRKKQEKMKTGFIFVMMVLHVLPRFQGASACTDWVEKITGKKPFTFAEFVEQELCRKLV